VSCELIPENTTSLASGILPLARQALQALLFTLRATAGRFTFHFQIASHSPMQAV
jgi:hypothetical protein